MHNRVRMITASFLCKDLLLDWRLGMDYFWQHLTCGDKPANTGGWQWSASVGTDAQPYFRVFNPVSQGQQHDPTGDYVRRYVPELAALPDAYIHAPWTLPGGEARRLGFAPGRTYPAPVVDHAARRLRAIAIFQQIRTESQMNR
jgi:deoxyribodipyrimidine photo-lyase